MTEIINAYSYLRISTDQQKVGDGIRRQLDASKEYALKKGYNLVETMSDIGISAFKGKNTKDGALGIFIAAINEGKIQTGSVLLVESLDRLSRESVLAAFAQFTSILEKGVGIVTLTDDQHYTAESVSNNVGQLFTSLGIMLRANEESVIKSKRIKAAWKRKRENIHDVKLTSMVPAWLTLSPDRKEFLINEAKADVVRHIFDLSLKGMGAYSITTQLNGDPEQYPPITSADKWNISYIKKILDNPAVHGQFQPKQRDDGRQVNAGEPLQDYYPAIVTKDTFNLLQSRFKNRGNRSAGRKGETYSNLFSGIIVCGSCGGTVLMKDKGKPPKGYKYLRCNNSLHNTSCKAPAWRYEQFETSFVQFVREVKFSELFSAKETTTDNLEGQRATAVTKLESSKVAYNALLSQFENPDLPPQVLTSLIARSKEILEAIETAQGSIDELDMRIAERSADSIDTEQQDFIITYDAIKKTDDIGQLREIRFAMNNLLRRTIDQITVYNSMSVYPWEVPDALSDQLRRSMGPLSDDALADYFGKPHGQRLYTESERYFTVKFKSGAERLVQPYEGKTYMSISERLAAMRKGA